MADGVATALSATSGVPASAPVTPTPQAHPMYNFSTPVPKPTNHLVTPLLTDLYQLTMCYAYWCVMQHAVPARAIVS